MSSKVNKRLKMWHKLMFCLLLLSDCALGYTVPTFETKNFKIGIEYDHSLPMSGGSDRYRHRNNWDPFYVTVTATAKIGYVISFLEVTATIDPQGELSFNVIRGQTGTYTIVFQIVSNNSDFLAYSYLVYGITEEEYKKLNNVISFPVNSATKSPLNYWKWLSISIIMLLFYCNK